MLADPVLVACTEVEVSGDLTVLSNLADKIAHDVDEPCNVTGHLASELGESLRAKAALLAVGLDDVLCSHEDGVHLKVAEGPDEQAEQLLR